MKLSLFDKNVENISALSDRPNIENGYTSTQLKAIFDKAAKDIKEYINTILIEELYSSSSDMCGAERIGSANIESVEGRSVQEKLMSLSQRINDLASGTIPPGSISPDSFSPEISAFLTSASIRANVFTAPGEHSFAVERDGIYKFTVVGGGAGGGVSLSNPTQRLGGGGGASLIVWLDLTVGDEVVLNIGHGGNGLTIDENSHFSSHATSGEDSTLYVNGECVATAHGGVFGLSTAALCEGGRISYSGGYPKACHCYNGQETEIEFSIGGDSILGRGASFAEDTPGIGGGGYAAKYRSANLYYAGYDGGDGGAIIEYLK